MTKLTQEQLSLLDTVGCDLGDKTSELFVIRRGGANSRPLPVPTTREGIRSHFEGRPKAHVVIEVGTHSRWVSALLEELGHEVTVANARKVKLISENDQKDDDVDAELLARLGRFDVKLLSPIVHRGEQPQADLAVIKARVALVECRTKLVNMARGLAKSFGFRFAKCDAEGFHRMTKQHIPKLLKPALMPLYRQLELLGKQIAAYDKLIEQIAKSRYPDTEILSQPKGVGIMTALVFILTIDDKSRFAKSRDVGPYLGLTRKRKKSGKQDPELHITKAGDPLLRRLLVQCAHYILGPFGTDSDLRRWGQELCKKNGKSAKKRARVALARKLAVLMHRLWVTGEVYEPIGYHKPKNVSAA